MLRDASTPLTPREIAHLVMDARGLAIEDHELFDVIIKRIRARAGLGVFPLGAGLLIRHLLANLAERLSGPLSKIATLLLAVAALAVLAGAWKPMLAQIGDGLGGPDPSDRTVLAISTASRHPGIALALIHMTAPDATQVLPVLPLYLLVNAIVGAPYVIWRKKSGVAPPSV